MLSLVAYEDSESEDEVLDQRVEAASAPVRPLSCAQHEDVSLCSDPKRLPSHEGFASAQTVLGLQGNTPERTHFHLQNSSGSVENCSVVTAEDTYNRNTTATLGFRGTEEKNEPQIDFLCPSKVSNPVKRHSIVQSSVRPYIPKRQRLVISTQVMDLQHPAEPVVKETWITESQDLSEVSKHPRLNLNEKPNTAEIPRKLLIRLEDHQGPVNTVQWCPLPRLSHLLLSASMDKTFKVWDGVRSGKCLRIYTCHSGAVRAACWTPCAQRLLTGSFDNMAVITDIETGVPTVKLDNQFKVMCVALHPSNPEVFLCGGYSSAVKAWDSRSCKVVKVYKAGIQQTLDILFLRGGADFITSSDCVSRDSADRTLIAWDFQTTAKISNQIYHERYTCPSLHHHPLEESFVAQTNGDYMAVFSSQRPFRMNKRRKFEGHKVEGYAVHCGFSSDGNLLASGSSSGSAYFYDYHSGRVLHTLCAHSQPCLCVSQHPILPTFAATCSWAGEIKVWH